MIDLETFGPPSGSKASSSLLSSETMEKHCKTLEKWHFPVESLIFLAFFLYFCQNYWYFVRRTQKMRFEGMELFKKYTKTIVFLTFLNCDFQKCWYFVRRTQKMRFGMDGVIQKTYEFMCCVSTCLKCVLSRIVKILVDFLDFSAWHGWSYWKTYIFLMFVDTFELWFSKMLIFA